MAGSYSVFALTKPLLAASYIAGGLRIYADRGKAVPSIEVLLKPNGNLYQVGCAIRLSYFTLHRGLPMGILTFILFLFVAAACAYLGERLVPGVVPGGFLTSAIVGIIGAWIGGSLMGHVGPDLVGVSLIPCILGSAILVFILSLCSRGFKGRKS